MDGGMDEVTLDGYGSSKWIAMDWSNDMASRSYKDVCLGSVGVALVLSLYLKLAVCYR